MEGVFIGRPEIPVFIHPTLNLKNLPEVIAAIARRIAKEKDTPNSEHIISAEASALYRYNTVKNGSNENVGYFRLKFHYCCHDFINKYNEEFQVIEQDRFYAVRQVPAIQNTGIPCH